MTPDQILTVVANGLITLGLYFSLKNYLPSYFKEKGKNLATKEDVGSITTIVELVKLENNAQLEQIKTELGLVSKAQIAVYDDERKAIVEFLGTVTDFYESNIDIPNESNSPEGLAYFTEKIRTLEQHYSKLQIANSKLQLFCHNKEILDASEPVLIALAEIQGTTQVQRFKVLGSQKVSAIMRELTLKTLTEENMRKLEGELDKQSQMQIEFQHMRLAFHREYYPKYSKLLDICKVYLKTKKATN
jgi:hypothetical protein